jgi:hypothetical protein
VVEADTDPAFQRLVLDNVVHFPRRSPLSSGTRSTICGRR